MLVPATSAQLTLDPGRAQARITLIRSDDPDIVYSEYVNANISADRANFNRSVINGIGAQHAPGTRINFATDATRVRLIADYRATLNNPGAGIFKVEIDGVLAKRMIGSDTDEGVETYPLCEHASPAVRREYSVIFPYGSNVAFLGLELSGGAPRLLAPPPPRPATLYVAYGDSITHGFDGTSTSAGYPGLVAKALGERVINMGFFGQAVTPGDGTAIAALAADRLSVAIGTNDWTFNTTAADFTTRYATLLDNIRTAQPDVPLQVITPTWTSSEGVLNSLGLTREDYRQMIRDVVFPRTVADSELFLIEGTVLVPPGSTYFPDGIHPNDLGFEYYASGLSDPNLIAEPGFETGGFAWSDLGSSEVVATAAHSGTSGLEIGRGVEGARQPVGRVRRGASLILSGWCRTNDVLEAAILGIRFLDENGIELSTQEIQSSSPTFEEVSLALTAPALFAYAEVFVTKEPGTATVQVDDLELIQIAPASVSSDGFTTVARYYGGGPSVGFVGNASLGATGSIILSGSGVTPRRTALLYQLVPRTSRIPGRAPWSLLNRAMVPLEGLRLPLTLPAALDIGDRVLLRSVRWAAEGNNVVEASPPLTITIRR